MNGSWQGQYGGTNSGQIVIELDDMGDHSVCAPMLMTITPGYRARLQRLGHLIKNADQNSMRPLLLSILQPGSRLNGKTLPNCHGLPMPKPCGVRGLAAEGLGWDNARDNIRGRGVCDQANGRATRSHQHVETVSY